jgi:hypothetical protein
MNRRTALILVAATWLAAALSNEGAAMQPHQQQPKKPEPAEPEPSGGKKPDR